MNGTCAALLVISTLTCGANPTPNGHVRAESVLITLVDQAEVAAQEPGALAEVAVREGQIVEEGDLLAKVEDSVAVITMRRAKIELDIAKKEESNESHVRY